MEFQQVIESRKSIKKYDGEQVVTEEVLRSMVEAATWSPSWKNAQTARYYCVCTPEVVAQFKQQCLPAFAPNHVVADAPAVIVTTFVQEQGTCGAGEEGAVVDNSWGYYDLGLHNQNLLLKGADLGLATIVLCIGDVNKLQELLAIPEEETIVSVIAVGYAELTPHIPPLTA